MIGKTSIGKSFYGVAHYVMDKEGAEILDAHGIRSHSAALAAKDFESIRDQHSRLNTAVWHTSISFAHEDKVDNSLTKSTRRPW